MKKKNNPKKKTTYRSERAKMARMLGEKMLSGEIPVVPPSQLARCPIPPKHVIDFDECCADYADGRINEVEAMQRVGDILQRIREPIKQDHRYEYKSSEPETEYAPPPPPVEETIPPPPPESFSPASEVVQPPPPPEYVTPKPKVDEQKAEE